MKTSTNNKKAIILLSGGLDSIVSLALAKSENIDFSLALIFDYGQKSFEKEYEASQKIADFYKIEHKCIKLDWLKEITNTSLVSGTDVPDVDVNSLDDIQASKASMKSVWVPNRNGLFLNIAAAFADSFETDYIIIGANKEEAATFSDNSKQFINDMNKVLETSTNYDIKVLAPLIDMDKNEIVQKAIELNAPLEFINSCYNNTQKHCGRCESCNRLKRALQNISWAGKKDLIEKLFEG